MKAIIWIIILALVAWGIWWFANRDEVGIPATAGETAGEVDGASDYLNASDSDDSGSYEGKG
jgi:hypothetical protein